MTVALNRAGQWLSSATEACELAKELLGENIEFILRERRVLYMKDGSLLTAWHGEEFADPQREEAVPFPRGRRSTSAALLVRA